MGVTQRQKEILQHSLGLSGSGAGKKYWRNYYAADPDDKELLELAESGLMKRGHEIPGGSIYYHVTDAGMVALGLITKDPT